MASTSSASSADTTTTIGIPTNTTSTQTTTVSTETATLPETTSASKTTRPTDTTTAEASSPTVTQTSTSTPATTPEETTTAIATHTLPGTSSNTTLPYAKSTHSPFDCSIDAYFVQGRHLLSVNLQSGHKKTLSKTVGGKSAMVNAIGFNTLDNFIYGLQGKTVVRVSHDGSLKPMLQGTTVANAGDVDADGQFYYSAGGKAWTQVDLKPGSASYGQVVAKGVSDLSALPRGLGAADWAFTPAVPGYLYSVGIDAQNVVYVVRWSMSSHRWEVSHKGVPSFGIKGSGFGAVVATSDGVLYASHNSSGAILRIPLDNPEGATKSALGPRAGTNDACRCASKPDEAL
ncbi:hypothetical protein ED733_004661 [Metarhizium rileyi]|uniref:DUF6923 domain-containing protein n=1 Tax=Metarhizium rileyi (strain RCEF 4871) TaxID=1649241 RepID=A0A5C6GEZ1_METRR|nr:hypothetical protein ED733_004661 [Metarhizium rileyi]